MNAITLIERCRRLGATFTTVNDHIKVQAPEPLPDDLITGLREAKSQVIIQLRRELKNQAECWLLEEWRRISLPEWQWILKESMEGKDWKREEYARWMLREVLEDPEYREEE